MTPENFCYWLQGLVELQDPEGLSKEQVLIIKEHLKLVFKKETKDYFKRPTFTPTQEPFPINPHWTENFLKVTC